MDAQKLLSTAETAQQLGDLPIRTLDQWAYRGIGPRFYKIGRHRKYSQADIDAWLQTRLREPAAQR